jgi:hypothetical protein
MRLWVSPNTIRQKEKNGSYCRKMITSIELITNQIFQVPFFQEDGLLSGTLTRVVCGEFWLYSGD